MVSHFTVVSVKREMTEKAYIKEGFFLNIRLHFKEDFFLKNHGNSHKCKLYYRNTEQALHPVLLYTRILFYNYRQVWYYGRFKKDDFYGGVSLQGEEEKRLPGRKYFKRGGK